MCFSVLSSCWFKITLMILHSWLVFLVKCTICWCRQVYLSAWEADICLIILFFQIMWLWVVNQAILCVYNLLNVFYCQFLVEGLRMISYKFHYICFIQIWGQFIGCEPFTRLRHDVWHWKEKIILTRHYDAGVTRR